MRNTKEVLFVVGILLLSGYAFFLVPSGTARTMSPLWSYTTSGTVYSISISEDGNFIVAGNRDGKVYLFSKAGPTPLWSYSTGDEVHSAAISADGSYIVAGSWDNSVYLFRKGSSTPVWSYTTGNSVLSVDISADGNYIVAGSGDSRVYLFRVGSSTPLWSRYLFGPVRSVSISADGSLLSAGWGSIYLFQRTSSVPLWSYSTGWGIQWVDISSSGEYLTAADGADDVYLFRTDSSTPLWTFNGPDTIWMVSISGMGEYIAAACNDYRVYLFHRSSSTPLWSYGTGFWATCVDVANDGNYLVAGSVSDKVFFFSTSSSRPMWNGRGGGQVDACSVSSHGEYVAAADSSIVRLFPGDDLPPEITNVSAYPQPQAAPGFINISADVIDDSPEVFVWANITYPDFSFSNVSMNLSSGNRYYSNQTYDMMGSYDFTIWARDPAGNWNSTAGTFSLSGGPPSSPPTNLHAYLQGPNLENIRITWTLSADDGAGNKDVTGYIIYRNEVFNVSGFGYEMYDSVPDGTSEYVDALAGEGNPSNFFYRICSVNTNLSLGCADHQVGKFTRPLSRGLQLISIPLMPSDKSIETALQTVAFESVWRYDSSKHKWRSYMISKTYRGTLQEVLVSEGLWVDVIRDCNLTVAGSVPIETQIYLRKGWNLVGFPSFDLNYTVATLKAETRATRIESFDPSAPYYLMMLNDVTSLQAGRGYWVRVKASITWTVKNS